MDQTTIPVIVIDDNEDNEKEKENAKEKQKDKENKPVIEKNELPNVVQENKYNTSDKTSEHISEIVEITDDTSNSSIATDISSTKVIIIDPDDTLPAASTTVTKPKSADIIEITDPAGDNFVVEFVDDAEAAPDEPTNKLDETDDDSLKGPKKPDEIDEIKTTTDDNVQSVNSDEQSTEVAQNPVVPEETTQTPVEEVTNVTENSAVTENQESDATSTVEKSDEIKKVESDRPNLPEIKKVKSDRPNLPDETKIKSDRLNVPVEIKKVESDRPNSSDKIKTVESDPPNVPGEIKKVESDRTNSSDKVKPVESDRINVPGEIKTAEGDRPNSSDKIKTVESDRPNSSDKIKTVESDRPSGSDIIKTVESDQPSVSNTIKTVESDRSKVLGEIKKTESDRSNPEKVVESDRSNDSSKAPELTETSCSIENEIAALERSSEETTSDVVNENVNGVDDKLHNTDGALESSTSSKPSVSDRETSKPIKIPSHIIGHNLEKPLESIKNGRVTVKPRLGVKVPYRNLTSQIVSKQDITDEIMERSRQRQGVVDPPTGSVLFAKKLTNRLANKLLPSKSKPSTEGTTTVSTVSVRPPLPPSDRIANNSDLIALLEGDDDTDWSLLDSKKTPIRDADWERETALKQLKELPKLGKKDMDEEPRFSLNPVTKTYTRKRKTSDDLKGIIDAAKKPALHQHSSKPTLGTPAKPLSAQTPNVKPSTPALHKPSVSKSTPTVPKASSELPRVVLTPQKVSSNQKTLVTQKPKFTEQKKGVELKQDVRTPLAQKHSNQKEIPEQKPSTSSVLKQKPNDPKSTPGVTQKQEVIKSTESRPPLPGLKPVVSLKQLSSMPKPAAQKPVVTPKTPPKPSIQKSIQNIRNMSAVQATPPSPASLPPHAKFSSDKKAIIILSSPPRIDDSTKPPSPKIDKIVTETKTPVATPLLPNTYISKSSRIIKRKKIWDPDDEVTTPAKLLKSPAASLIEKKAALTEKKATPVEKKATPVEKKATPVEKKATPVEKNATPVEKNATPVEKNATPVGKKPAPVEKKPSVENKTTVGKAPVESETDSDKDEKLLVEKTSTTFEKRTQKPVRRIFKRGVAKKRQQRAKRTEIDRLLMDEGAINLLYSVKNADPVRKRTKSVISIDKYERELMNRTNEIKNDLLQHNTVIDTPISLRKKGGKGVFKDPAALIMNRKKSKDSAEGSVHTHTPPASPAYAFHEVSRIIRRHSSSSFTSQDSEDEDSADEVSLSERIKSEKSPKVINISEINATNENAANSSKYSEFKTLQIRKIDNMVQIILIPETPAANIILTLDVLEELTEILNLLQVDETCRVVVLTSAGTTFCLGIDYKELASSNYKERNSIAKQYAIAVRTFLLTLSKFTKLIIAGVQGNAVGLGVTMLPLFDMVMASDTATFEAPYARLGCAAEGGMLLKLPHMLHNVLACELFFAPRAITAAEAFRLGLVTRILWPAKFQDELISTIKVMSCQSLQSMEAIKQQLRHQLLLNVEPVLKSESRMLIQHWTSNECQTNFANYILQSK